LPGASADLSQATYCLHHETHTIGNPLRWMLMKNPKVEFCGYSMPHPSEPKLHLRIQMYDGLSSLDALMEALDNLENLVDVVGEAYDKSVKAGKYATLSERL
ncbi:RBP11-like subunits of RNA polymerase, partial [Clavulina sp. PMI_390]